MARVLVPVADGSEEMETVILVDVLRRAGWEVILASIQGEGSITGARGTQLIPDACWETLDLLSFDLLALPGGRGRPPLPGRARSPPWGSGVRRG